MKRILPLLFLCYYHVTSAQINLSQGLVTYHPFNGNADDAGPNTIHGNVVNATLTTDRMGNANSAYYFNGSNAFIELPYNTAYNFSPQGAFSISVWILPDMNNTWPAQAVVVKAPPNADFTLSAWNYGTYVLSYHAMSGYAYNHILNGTTSFVQNLCWYNVITTYNNGIWNLYVNGQLEATNNSQTRFILQDGFSRIAFGKKGQSFGDWYKGKMDEVRIYNRVLNQEEIDSLAFNTAGTKTIDDVTICQGGSFQLNATGASTYTWSPAAGLSSTTVANPIASPVTTTRYYVTGTQASGCTSTDNVLVTVHPKPVITRSNDTLICQHSSVRLFANGGATYNWSPATGLDNATVPDPIATPLTTTRYIISVTSNQGCTEKDSVLINVREPGLFSISPAAEICSTGSVQLNAGGGDLYNWTPPGTLSNPGIANPTATPTQTTPYSVSITDTICLISSSLSTTVTVHPLPEIGITKTNNIDCSFSNSQLNATGGVQYRWQPDPTLSNANIANPVAAPIKTTQYVVNGVDPHGCSNTDSITVFVTTDNKSLYLMPGGFTPNNDGINDCYGIKYWGAITELDFSIYNRWGERIFHTTVPSACWDGKINGVTQDAAVFIYVVKAKTLCGDVFRKGTFALIR
ncbi:MAG: gliding motility-associated C-terminal domain-containing protein [Sphingobacteriales bacterium]|nr:gliding motility-associated C-terminal domain-containing protein [Sphingobacteriales bacterium]